MRKAALGTYGYIIAHSAFIALLTIGLFFLAGCDAQVDKARAADGARILRVAVIGPARADCLSDSDRWPARQRAYAQRLSQSMGLATQLCAYPTREAAATALSQREVDLALLEPLR
ncbi:hypothetical protein GTZ99_02465 [Novosphingobium sp. FSY-8]|uniref:Uncharacterized protein n=1 Tax=Novosphingobium ovatum TaxID=1908523 RepID=A0ABW9XA55_9SPHN|nr:hypothetical protein [Novosphingobium ovatum]NBC35416.1 hypothetical protein [Novosphingobium ovatum]